MITFKFSRPNIHNNNIDQDIVILNVYTMTNTYTPGVVFSQRDGDPADSMAGFHVSILNSLSELLLECQHLRDQFQQSVHISTSHKHKQIQRKSRIRIYETATFNKNELKKKKRERNAVDKITGCKAEESQPVNINLTHTAHS